MKKFFLMLALLVVGVGTSVAQESVIRLMDEVVNLPGCRQAGSGSCAELDGSSAAQVQKMVRLERFVPGSGFLAVFFEDKTSFGTSYEGGFDYDQIYFEPNSGGRVPVGAGLQVFERGNIVAEFYQPYTTGERLPVQYDFVWYYLPHSDSQRDNFLLSLQDDPQEFDRFKENNKRNIDTLCSAVSGQGKIPNGCPGAGRVDTSDGSNFFDSDTSSLTTDPNLLPELDFSGDARRRPEVTPADDERLVFVGEPVTLELERVYDPDGKCEFFQYSWEKPNNMQVADVSVDLRLGDLFFVPQNVGSFTVRVRAREACGSEMGNLISEAAFVRVIVNDKATDFPDLRGNRYANAMYDMYHLNVLKGYPDGTMRPDAPVNRAEFLKMIFETIDYRISDRVFSPRYPDVLTDAWFADYVHQADTLGVIKGYPDGFFRPEQTVNLVEALKMAMQFSTLEVMDGTVYSFPDVRNTEWYSRYVQTAYREGILDDIRPGRYVSPNQAISRGKAAEIIIRTLIFPVNRINQVNKDVLRRPDAFEDFSSFDY